MYSSTKNKTNAQTLLYSIKSPLNTPINSFLERMFVQGTFGRQNGPLKSIF